MDWCGTLFPLNVCRGILYILSSEYLFVRCIKLIQSGNSDALQVLGFYSLAGSFAAAGPQLLPSDLQLLGASYTLATTALTQACETFHLSLYPTISYTWPLMPRPAQPSLAFYPTTVLHMISCQYRTQHQQRVAILRYMALNNILEAVPNKLSKYRR